MPVAQSLDLACLETGAGAPIVILHGLFGSSRNWNMIARRLGESRRVLALDLRNHGASPWAAPADYPSMAGDVARFIASRGLGPCPVLGHSMGGKVALWLALTRPELVDRVIAADIAPVAYARSTLIDYIHAMQALDLGRYGRRAEVEAALAPVVTDAGERSFLMQNLVMDDGRLRWRINLDVLERDFPAIVGFPATAPDARFDGPALFLAGERSRYIQPDHQPEISRLFPRSRLVTIAGAGHWLHAEQPERVFDALHGFLAS